MTTEPEICDLDPADKDEVEALLLAAFPGPEEAALVCRLRADGLMVSELVLRWQGRIGAYAGISRMIAPIGWLALAPVAVLPNWHGRHFGTRLVDHCTRPFLGSSSQPNQMPLPQDEHPTLVVLGKPSFYARCGFSLDRAEQLNGPYPIQYTLIARPGDDVPKVSLTYPPAFDGV